MCIVCKGHHQNDLYSVRWDVKPYSLTHVITGARSFPLAVEFLAELQNLPFSVEF